MSIKRWCLGFVFSTDLQHVVLLKKGKSLHVGLWNGLGGAIEPGESVRDAMVRECQEESGLDLDSSRWVKVGTLMRGGTWHVDVLATKLQESEASSLAYLEEGIMWTSPSRVSEFVPDVAAMTPVSIVQKLKAAPHVGALVHASLEALKDPKTPLITMSLQTL
jgi:8-oxo-dGTP pyrophosphatase MutT (NUDIX family)